MSKINVWGLEREEPPVHDVAITSNDGEEFAFKIQATDNLRASLMIDRFNALVETYITGSEEKETAPIPFPQIAGRQVVVSRAAFEVAATLEAVCVGQDAYTAEEFIALSHARPEVVKELLKKVRTIQGNELQGGSEHGKHLSESPSDTATIQTS